MNLYLLLAALPFVAGDFLRNSRGLAATCAVIPIYEAGEIVDYACPAHCQLKIHKKKPMCIPYNPSPKKKKDPECTLPKVVCNLDDTCCDDATCTTVQEDPTCVGPPCDEISYCCIDFGVACVADEECCGDLVCDLEAETPVCG